MSGDHDSILDRLREIDPARGDDRDEATIRASVKRRGEAELARSNGRSWTTGRKLALAGVSAAAAAAVAAVLLGSGDGLAPGPANALAIEPGPKGVTLTIEDPNASAEEMNRELEAAGIDRVRVFTVPGSPNHAGTWAGSIDLAPNCASGPSALGYGIRIPYHVIDAPPAPGREFIDLELPLGKTGADQAIVSSVGVQSGSGKRAIVSTDDDDSGNYAPSVLIAIRARQEGDPPDAKAFGVEELAALGGDFEPYAEALADGQADCEELGLDPPPPEPSAAALNADSLLSEGPVSGRCVVKVLGVGLFSIEGELTARDARKIHACSDRIGEAAAREHAQLRARRHRQIEQIDSEADLPAFVRARLDRSRSAQRAPHGGVKPGKRGIDTGTVVLEDPDGHDHRTSPKRLGEYINLHCAARGDSDREFFATTVLDGEPIANARVSCRAHGPWRSSHVVKVSEPGTYEIHLNGAGFDDFVIRARTTTAPGGDANELAPPP